MTSENEPERSYWNAQNRCCSLVSDAFPEPERDSGGVL